MNKLLRLPYISILVALLVTSCRGSTPTPAPLVAQATPASLVNLELAIQADTSIQYTKVGDIIRFNFPVKNTGIEGIAGIVTLTGVAAVCPALNTVGNGNDSLDAGESVNCTMDYPVTQADLDKGSVAIAATATINGINSNQATSTIPVGLPKALSITVTAAPATYAQAGDKITFTYIIKNDGANTLGPAQFTVSDNLISSAPFTCGNPDTTLPAGQTLTCSAVYTVTDINITQPSFFNQATATGGGSSTTQAGSVTVSKGAPQPSNNYTKGNTITHTVVEGEWLWHIARCWGADPNAVIAANRQQLPTPSLIKAGIKLSIPNIGSNGTIYGEPCTVEHKVASGDTWESIAKQYNADPNILRMIKRNFLTVGSIVYVPKNSFGASSSSTTSPNPSSPTTSKSLAVTVSANPTTYSNVGQQILFTYVIKNTGNTNLGPDQFKIQDSLIGTEAFNCGNAGTTLPPNLTVTCSATYTITQADMDKSTQSNNAVASGGGVPTSTAASATISKAVSGLSLTVTANPTTYTQAGQIITFNYEIKNNGTVNLGPAQFTIKDDLIGETEFNCGEPNITLIPGGTVSCIKTYEITDADMQESQISNHAVALGAGAPASPAANATLTKQ